MKPALIICGIIALLYLLLSLALAKFFAVLILKPPKKFRPSYEDIRQQKVKEIANDKAVYAGIDWDEFDQWEREKFQIKNGDVVINGEFFPVPHQRGVVICAHGFGQNKLQMAPHAALYRELGFSAVLYDQRRWGESAAPFCSFGWFEADDLVKLAEWAKVKCGQNTKIVVTGVSMGAVTVMNALSRTNMIDCAVEDCGFARIKEGIRFLYKSFFPVANPFLWAILFHDAHRLGIPVEENNPAASVAQTDTPLLIIHGNQDRAVNVQDAYVINKAAKSPLSRLKIFPGIDHGYCLSDKALCKAAVSDFLNEVLKLEEDRA